MKRQTKIIMAMIGTFLCVVGTGLGLHETWGLVCAFIGCALLLSAIAASFR